VRITLQPMTEAGGYIYILQNVSLPESRLKIGRTTIHPDSRASDLSRATGVPTPFTVVWYSETCDCYLAEKIVHERLAEYRTNPRREFFDLDLPSAILVAEDAVDRAGRAARRSGSFSVVSAMAKVIASVFSGGWQVIVFFLKVIGYTIRLVLKLCLMLCVTLPLALIAGLFSGLAGKPLKRGRRRRSPW
jgi:hypothetical protein